MLNAGAVSRNKLLPVLISTFLLINPKSSGNEFLELDYLA